MNARSILPSPAVLTYLPSGRLGIPSTVPTRPGLRDPEHAVGSWFGMTYASLGRYLGRGTMPDLIGQGDWDTLLSNLSLMALFFLPGDLSDVITLPELQADSAISHQRSFLFF
jgi:hypothetical protein